MRRADGDFIRYVREYVAAYPDILESALQALSQGMQDALVEKTARASDMDSVIFWLTQNRKDIAIALLEKWGDKCSLRTEAIVEQIRKMPDFDTVKE